MILVLTAGCGSISKSADGQIPVEKAPATKPDFAKPVADAHLKNFFQVDDHVYRCAQPDEEDFPRLKALGITDVLNLREYHSDNDEAEDSKLALHRVSMAAGDIQQKDVIQALRIMNGAKGKVLVHCWHGSDRTGVVCAMWRITADGWTREQALDELKNGPFHFHAAIYGNIEKFIQTADVDAIKKAAFAKTEVAQP